MCVSQNNSPCIVHDIQTFNLPTDLAYIILWKDLGVDTCTWSRQGYHSLAFLLYIGGLYNSY